jgi:3-phosphoshikimate 1-carboxyvinyltransferase
MIEIIPRPWYRDDIEVPGSKSYTHRCLIAAALSDGPCTLVNALDSEDTRLTAQALRQVGITIAWKKRTIDVSGANGKLQASSDPIYLGNSGTSMRLLAAVTALGHHSYRLEGTARMHERPVKELLQGLEQIGINAFAVHGNGCPPIIVEGGTVTANRVELDCRASSQYLSGMLLIGPYIKGGLDIVVTHGPVSKPYVDMTVDIMERHGIELRRQGYQHFAVSGGQTYAPGAYEVEADGSQAGYFWAAAAVTGGSARVKGVSLSSRQGDVQLANLLAQMGCRLIEDSRGITVIGGPLSGIDVDMSDMPDMVPTLAVVAAFAAGQTVIRNVAHLRAKESDRLAAVAAGLTKMGINAIVTDDGLVIKGGSPQGAQIDTYDDHRIAMSFAVAGLKAPGVYIKDEMCVKKSFPNFWDVFQSFQPL